MKHKDLKRKSCVFTCYFIGSVVKIVLSEAATIVVLQKKLFQKFWNINRKTLMLEALFNKVAGLKNCCKTYLLHALLRFSLGKTLKNYFINFL